MRHLPRVASLAWACLLSLVFAGLVFAGLGTARAQLNPCEEPNVLVVLDRSGSMLDGNPSKYNQAVTAINQLTAGFQDRIRFGLLVFPNAGDCGVTLPGAVLAPVNINNGAAITAQLNGNARPNPNNNTPIGLSIQRAREYLLGLNDPDRRRFIVLVTDGIERCNGNGANQARTALQNDIPTYVIGFGNGVDGNALNSIAREGGTNSAYQANNAAQLSAVLAAIANAASAETCDGRDNDCDGQVDEAVPDVPCQTACGDGRQICQNGALSICFPTEPPPEVCDGADNDCDGRADEDVPAGGACATGQPGVCADGVDTCQGGAQVCLPVVPASDEACDGVDNDCDGQLDEGFGVGEPCDTGLLGVCADGAQACGVNEVICRPQVPSSPESCDGLDNDCDGAVDNGLPDLGTDCATGQPGICALGRSLCLGGQVQCNSDVVPISEDCNGTDDDCDGRVDEGVRNACGRCAVAAPDACDGIDSDCDGAVDEDAMCPGSQRCAFGGCYDPCRNNECSGGLSCVDQVCVAACVADPCPPGEDCTAGGQCVDPCADVDCGPGEVCNAGRCVGPDNCAALGCPVATVCTTDGCVADACEGLECAPDELCRAGLCVGSCAFVACPLGESCTDGVCQTAPCGGQQCPDGQMCGGAECEADPCAGVTCGQGEACVGGLCIADPCNAARCPQGERCVLQDGVAQCERDDGFAPEPGAGGDGGEGGEGGAGGGDGPGAGGNAGGGSGGDDEGGEDGDGNPLPDRDAGVVVSADALEGGCACNVGVEKGRGGAPALVLTLAVLLGWPRRRR